MSFEVGFECCYGFRLLYVKEHVVPEPGGSAAESSSTHGAEA